MKDLRSNQNVIRGKPFEIEVDGEKIIAHPGETVAAAMTAAGKLTLNYTTHETPRGIFCGIGLCWSCLIEVNGTPNKRACQTLAVPGCQVRTQKGPGKWQAHQ
jgi:predicted molibdopterin-dependent oxidoreductase YjgC